MKHRIMWILWPAFVVAAVSEMLFFAFIDPVELHLFGNPNELSRMTTYSVFFFVFWAMGACSSALTCWLQGGGHHIPSSAATAGASPERDATGGGG